MPGEIGIRGSVNADLQIHVRTLAGTYRNFISQGMPAAVGIYKDKRKNFARSVLLGTKYDIKSKLSISQSGDLIGGKFVGKICSRVSL